MISSTCLECLKLFEIALRCYSFEFELLKLWLNFDILLDLGQKVKYWVENHKIGTDGFSDK